MTDNPFEQLGWRKEFVQSIYAAAQGQDDKILELVSNYRRTVLTTAHPDKGGDDDLSARVNVAYDQLRKYPHDIKKWIDTMKDGDNEEYKAIVARLVSRLEKLKKVEQEKQEIARKYSDLIASRARGGSDVRMLEEALIRAERAEHQLQTLSVDYQNLDTKYQSLEAEYKKTVYSPSGRPRNFFNHPIFIGVSAALALNTCFLLVRSYNDIKTEQEESLSTKVTLPEFYRAIENKDYQGLIRAINYHVGTRPAKRLEFQGADVLGQLFTDLTALTFFPDSVDTSHNPYQYERRFKEALMQNPEIARIVRENKKLILNYQPKLKF